jgi:hypothetical protein
MWIGAAGEAFVRELLDAKRAPTMALRIRLRLLKAFLLPLALLLRVRHTEIVSRLLANNVSIQKRAALVLAALGKFIAVPVAGTVDLLANLEWRCGRRRSNGSAQYLVFYKPLEPADDDSR